MFLAEFMNSFSLRSRNLINLITSLLILLPPLLRTLVAESSVNEVRAYVCAFGICSIVSVDGIIGIIRMATMLAGACDGDDAFYDRFAPDWERGSSFRFPFIFILSFRGVLLYQFGHGSHFKNGESDVGVSLVFVYRRHYRIIKGAKK